MLCFLCTVLGIVSVTFAQYPEEKVIMQLNDDENDMIMTASERCKEEIGVKVKTVKRFFMFKVEPDVETKDFLYCVLVGLDFATVEGHFTQKFLSLYDLHPMWNDVKHVFNSCKSDDKLRYIDTLYAEVNCFFTKTPVRLGRL